MLGRPGHRRADPRTLHRNPGGRELAVGQPLRLGFGALMYFATLTEVPILQGLIGAGMGKGPGAGPAAGRPGPFAPQHAGHRRSHGSEEDGRVLLHHRGVVHHRRHVLRLADGVIFDRKRYGQMNGKTKSRNSKQGAQEGGNRLPSLLEERIMNEKRLVLILGLAGFVVMADNWVVSPILPAIAQSLKVSPVRAGLLITAYMIPFGLFQLVFGPLADRYGKKKIITISMVLFTACTALCAIGIRPLRPFALPRPDRSVRRFRNAHFPGADRRHGPHGKKTAGDRHFHGNRVSRPGTEHGHRRNDSLFRELAGSISSRTRLLSLISTILLFSLGSKTRLLKRTRTAVS